MRFDAVDILGVRVTTARLEELLAYIRATITAGQRAVLGYANVHALNLACADPEFRALLNRADLIFCDGFGVKLGARLLGQHIPARYTPPDWLDLLADLAARQGYRVALVGGRPGVAQRAARRLAANHPGLILAGAYHGYFAKTSGAPENEALIAAINAAQPHILIVGFGMPIQERWIAENWGRLAVQVVLPVGAGLDYVSGAVPRGPRWLTDHGFEWLSRLLVEPGRLWRRYLLGNPQFLARILAQRMGRARFALSDER